MHSNKSFQPTPVSSLRSSTGAAETVEDDQTDLDELRLQSLGMWRGRVVSCIGPRAEKTPRIFWYPLSAIRKIDPEFRREALFRFANKIATEHGWQKPFAMPKTQSQGNANNTNSRDLVLTAPRRRPQQAAQDQQAVVCLQILGLSEMPKSFDAVKLAYREGFENFKPREICWRTIKGIAIR